jgi:hypothetical protein
MSLIALVVAAGVTAAPAPTLLLERVRSADDPRSYQINEPETGDRGIPSSCSLSAKTTVTQTRSGRIVTLTVTRDGGKKAVTIQDVQGLARPTLACGEADDFYYVNPKHGQIFAYSGDRLFRGLDPVVWTRSVAPFTNIDDAGGAMIDASVATAIQVRQKLVLVEWFFRKNGTTGFWHEVLDGATGTELAKIGPSDLLLKTNEHDPWWIVFQGGGNETVNYVPSAIYRLRFGPPAGGVTPAAETIQALSSQAPPPRAKALTKLSTNPVINHMVALLSPSRTTPSSTIEFCPAVPAQRARYWLGGDYDDMLATLARNILLSFWAEGQEAGASGSPIDVWFQAEIAPNEPMKTLLTHFNPQDDAWVAQYQEALLQQGRPTFDRLFNEYGVGTGAVVRTPK